MYLFFYWETLQINKKKDFLYEFSTQKNQICITVPVYNEEKILSVNYSYWYQLSRAAELIFVDGGSTDRSNVYSFATPPIHKKLFY